MGGRPRTPTNIIQMRGGFKNHPERRKDRENEPVVTEPIGQPPAAFDELQLQAWRDITSQCALGVLTIADSLAVENAARLLTRERLGMNSDAAGRRLDSLLGKFGMTPSERSKVSAAKKAKGNRFEEVG